MPRCISAPWKTVRMPSANADLVAVVGDNSLRILWASSAWPPIAVERSFYKSASTTTPLTDSYGASKRRLDYDYENLPYDCGGLLKNKSDDKQCLAPIRSGIKRGRRLALDRCDKDDVKQQWLVDGDILSPESKTRLCVWFRGELEERAPMVLKKCENLDSLNFGRK